MRHPIVMIASEVKVIAYPIERRSFGIREMPSPRLHEEIEEDHVVRESGELVIPVRDDYCDELT